LPNSKSVEGEAQHPVPSTADLASPSCRRSSSWRRWRRAADPCAFARLYACAVREPADCGGDESRDRPEFQSAGECSSESPCGDRSEEHTSELQSRFDLVCRLLLEKKNKDYDYRSPLNDPHHPELF